MPGTRSLQGFVIRQDTTAFSADTPMSALQTFVLRQNTQHLIDAACQVRYNWIASTSESGFTALEGDDTRSQFACTIPCTLTDPNTLPSFDISIATRCTGTLTSGTFTWTLRERYNNTPLATPTGLAFGSATVSTASPTWHHFTTDILEPHDGKDIRFGYKDASINGGTPTMTTTWKFVLLALHIYAVPSNPVDGQIGICGVHVREYLSQ